MYIRKIFLKCNDKFRKRLTFREKINLAGLYFNRNDGASTKNIEESKI